MQDSGSRKLISLICPCFNEQDSIEHFIAEMNKQPLYEQYDIEFVFVNDGSTDATLEVLLALQNQNKAIRIIDLSRNFGKESALKAGIEKAKGDYIIPIDVDLQDPPRLIIQMLDKLNEGYDVVVAKRTNRDSDSVAKRISAELYYKLHNKISKTPMPENVGDFRVFNRKVAEALRALPENQLFMKGIFAWVGFSTATINYTREARTSGYSKFSPWKLWNFAIEGVTSFSTVPLRIWTYLGMLISALAFIYGFLIVVKTLFLGVDVPGYASLLTSILFLGGKQLISIGVLGEYIGRIYIESKKRPPYVIKDEY